MKLSYLILWVLLVLTACGDDEPDCVRQEIDRFRMAQADCPGARIEKVRLEGMILYGFSDGSCIADGGTTLIDEQCNSVCLIGGIGGLTECKGVDYSANAEVVEVIWQN